MQVRRLSIETGLLYSETYGNPVLTYGEKSMIFVLSQTNLDDGQIFHNRESKLNKSVYVFHWSVTSLFHYDEFRRRVLTCFPVVPNPRRYYPTLTLPHALCVELLEKGMLLLDGNLEKSSSYRFYYWIIDKGHGNFNVCINSFLDALLFLPTRIVDKESGQLIRL